MSLPARTLQAVQRARSFRLVLATVLLLNALGSPMAWAHLLGTGGHARAAASEMAPTCHDSGASGHDQSAPHSMPCCDGAGCTCAAAAIVVLDSTQPARIPQATLSAPADTSALPAHPLDDTLRPPIR
jgi:hypothetical protein